ncbi:MAG: hypothetical protein FWC78_01580 [Defluviitaleaceae bacterium]|nr:hypothetical protein [Defluviitaleaceae bacterium]
MYEKAFGTKAGGYDYSGDGKIRHAEMNIHGQKVFLNDGKAFLLGSFGVGCVAHLAVTFATPERLLACYEKMKAGSMPDAPFVKTEYSELVGNFMDKFGVIWGFIVGE